MSKPNPLDFRVLPIPDTDLIPFYIGSDTSRPFWVSWGNIKKILQSGGGGTAAWGSIQTGTGIPSQTDLVNYLAANFYPLSSNPAGYITSPALTAILANYVTTSLLASTLTNYVTTVALTAILSGYVTSGDLIIALGNYVPNSRTITINGVTFDLSSNRSWTVSGSATIAKTTVAGTTVTGTTANTISQSLLVPANSFSTGSIGRVTWRASKVGVAGTFVARYYVNTVNSLTGATFLGFATTAGLATIRLLQMERHLNIRNNTTQTQVWSLTTSIVSDTNISTAAGWDIVAVDHTVDLYHIMAIQNTAVGDATTVEFILIENL